MHESHLSCNAAPEGRPAAISGFCRGVNEIFALLGYYVTQVILHGLIDP
jgi:hypothetical protein